MVGGVRWGRVVPAALALAGAGLIALGLGESALRRDPGVGVTLPAFALAGLPGQPGLSRADVQAGAPMLVNIWASWCPPCRVEMPVLNALAARGIPIAGVAVRDEAPAMTAFLARHGNPYRRIGLDRDGAVLRGSGASGIPETLVVDAQGRVIARHRGVLTTEDAQRLVRVVARAGHE